MSRVTTSRRVTEIPTSSIRSLTEKVSTLQPVSTIPETLSQIISTKHATMYTTVMPGFTEDTQQQCQKAISRELQQQVCLTRRVSRRKY